MILYFTYLVVFVENWFQKTACHIILHIIDFESCPSEFVRVLCEHPLPGVCLAVYIFRWPERRRHLNRLGRQLSLRCFSSVPTFTVF